MGLMFIAQVNVACDENDKVADCFDLLLSQWRSNGQVLGKEFPIAEIDNVYQAFLMVPQPDALDAVHDNEYSKSARKKLETLTTLSVQILSQESESIDPCNCKKRLSLILYTNYVSLESPLRCGDCFGPIPLYVLKKQEMSRGELHDQIMSWQSDYEACDTLQMNCATGEKFGLREITRFDSSLSKRGREVCEVIENATQTPTFYYLLRYYGRSKKAERERKCPSCGGDWLLEEKLLDLFDFKCDACRLLSNIAFSF